MQMLLEVENCSVTSICSVCDMPHIICDIQYATYHMLHLQGFKILVAELIWWWSHVHMLRSHHPVDRQAECSRLPLFIKTTAFCTLPVIPYFTPDG